MGTAMRILLVDDHAVVREGLRNLLERAGFAVVGEAGDGREALPLAEKLRPDVAVIDLAMPALNGLGTLKRLRAQGLPTKSILLTCHTERQYVVAAFEAGASGYVIKTQATADLVPAMDFVCTEGELRSAEAEQRGAAKELERCVTQLGLRGALVNAHTQGRYLDDPTLRVVWEYACGLNVPLYLHPANGFDSAHVLSGHPELIGPMWSWGTDTAAHVLRLVFGGVFDDFPEAILLLGHMGEGLPYALWRLDSRWAFHNHHGIELARGNPSAYLRHNLYITTSGVCDAPPLLCAMLALGADHILFATDYPFEDMAAATAFLRGAPISDADRAKIAHGNAERLLGL